jgi:Zn-dependent protease
VASTDRNRAGRLNYRGPAPRRQFCTSLFLKGKAPAADLRNMEARDKPVRVRLAIGRSAAAPAIVLGLIFGVVAARAGLPAAVACAVGAVGGPLSLIVHELGHVRAARRCASVRPVVISLGWFGAATRLEGRYTRAGEQARVAIAGPTASFTLAVSILLSMQALPLSVGGRELAIMLALFNVAVGVLNLIPASPLDGYKLIVALFWSMLGSEAAARRVLRRIGLTLAAVEIPGVVFLATEKPAVGLFVLAIAAAHFGQKRLLAHIHR